MDYSKIISFIYYGQGEISSFIQADIDILSKDFKLDIINYNSIKDIPKLVLSILKSDISYSWFAGGHAALAVLFSRLFRKKSIVVLGGYEVANLPEIGYGACLSRKSAILAKFALKYANRVFAVDESLKREALQNYRLTGENIIIIPTCYDSEYFKPDDKPKENIVLTVSPKSAYARKGIPLLIKAAKNMPNVKFYIVGKGDENSSGNVIFTGYVSKRLLLKYYQKAKVYCQLSLHEGLPNALCEAMLCECIPVGSLANGIPTAIGDTGFYGITKLEEALNSSKDKGRQARQRIINLFSERDLKSEILRI